MRRCWPKPTRSRASAYSSPNARCSAALECLSGFLDRELVHAGENAGVFAFEPVPAIEIDHGGVLGIFRRVCTEHPRIELPAQQMELLGRQEGRDLRKRVLIFLDVEQEVAAIAGRVEIARRDDGLAGRAIRKRKNLLPAAPDVLRPGA